MRALGSALIVEDPFEVVDVIVVSVDADGAGVLEAADLVKRGVAKRVAIFAKPLNRSDQEFARRGLPAEDEATRQIRELRRSASRTPSAFCSAMREPTGSPGASALDGCTRL